MKISPAQLEQQIENRLLPLYWVASDEPFLLQDVSDKIREYAKKNGYSNKVIFYCETKFNWDQFIAETQNLSLFSDKTFIELRLSDRKFPDDGRKILAEYLTKPANDKLILVTSEKIDIATQKSKWFEAIEKNSGFIAVWPLTTSERHHWIERRLKASMLTASKEVIQLLAEQGEGNLLAVNQEIEKLSLLYPNSHLSLEQVRSAISDNSRYDVFELMDAVLAANPIRIIKILQALRQEGTEPILILWAIAKDTRMLLSLKEKNDPLTESSLRKYGIWPKRMSLIKLAMQRGSITEYQNILQLCGKIDLMIKGIESGNVWDSLERASLMLAGINIYA